MKSLIGKRGKKSGLHPESLVFVGEKKTEKVKINLINYNEINFEEKEIKKVDECQEYKSKAVTWINVEGVHDVTIIEKLGKDFEIHPLVLEDILNTDQRPKKEDFTNNIFIVLKMLSLNKNNEIISEQVSMVVAPRYLITFQEGIEGVWKLFEDEPIYVQPFSARDLHFVESYPRLEGVHKWAFKNILDLLSHPSCYATVPFSV